MILFLIINFFLKLSFANYFKKFWYFYLVKNFKFIYILYLFRQQTKRNDIKTKQEKDDLKFKLITKKGYLMIKMLELY